jgi:hypothetical protein
MLKNVALNFIIGVLRGMIKDAIPRMVEMADQFLSSLEDRIIDLFAKATPEERLIFRENIKKYFPNSRLLDKLNG